MRKYLNAGIFTTALILLFSNVLFAQDDEYQKWLKQQQQQYSEHIAKEDKAFSEFLLKNWKTYQVKEETPADTKPKPVKPPVVQLPDKKKPTEKNQEQKPVVIIPAEKKKPEPKDNDNKKSNDATVVQTIPENTSKCEIDFYDAGLTFYIPRDLPNLKLKGAVTKELIGDYWQKISSLNYEPLMKSFLSKRDEDNLNGWGYCQLLNFTAKKIYPDLRNERQLFIWFMLTKSGYQARVGIDGANVYLLLPFTDEVFDVPFFKIGGSDTRMYIIDFDDWKNLSVENIVTYDGDYSKSNSILEIGFAKPIKISDKFLTKTMEFTYRDTTYKFDVKYNNSLTKFFYNYPYVNLSVYFNSRVSKEIKESLVDGLKPIIKNKPVPEAVNIILHFVQTAFGYILDENQFNREKPLFVEETVFYKGCDCEDRSILFAFLVKELLGLEVVGLDYPGHVAAAVRFDETEPGDFVQYKGAKFTITDPTYMEASIGMCMPEYKNMNPLHIIATTK